MARASNEDGGETGAAGLYGVCAGGEDSAIEMVGVQMVEGIFALDGKALIREGCCKGRRKAAAIGRFDPSCRRTTLGRSFNAVDGVDSTFSQLKSNGLEPGTRLLLSQALGVAPTPT